MTVLHVIFVKCIVISFLHAFTSNHEARHHSCCDHHEQEYNYIFSKIIFQFLRNSSPQWILHNRSPFFPNLNNYQSRSAAEILFSFTSLCLIIPSLSFTVLSAIFLIASLCVTMMIVLPYFPLTSSISFNISLDVL